MLDQFACHLRYALIVMVVVVVIILLSRWTGKKSATLIVEKPAAAAPSVARSSGVAAIVAEAAAANEAAHAQTDRLDALVNVTSALATLNAADSLAGSDAVSAAAGAPIQTLQHELGAHQYQLMLEISGGRGDSRDRGSLQPLPKI